MADHTNKEVVIAMRTALKAGKNLPLKVYGDNVHVLIDEAAAFAFTIWDDDNGVVYYFRLIDIDQSRIPDNAHEQSISVSAVKYEFIQAMEVAPMPLTKLDAICSTIKASSTDMLFPDEFKDHMKYVFERALSDKTPDLYASDINAAHGVEVVSPSDDYYLGRFSESYQETHTPELRYHKQRLASQQQNNESNP